MSYIKSLVKYYRRESVEVKIGNASMGGINPIRVQTMLNTDTNDINASVEQAIRCIEAGAELIRLTAQGETEAKNLKKIKNELLKRGFNTPLIADVHFNPKVAEIAAEIVEKVRINPGNYTDKKTLKNIDISDEDYKADLEKIENRLVPLLDICKKNGTAIRIGTNHGSLSDRILNKFGDTPEGMAESAMEFLRICKKHNFRNIVLSMKASNTRIMVYATRLLVKKMNNENMQFPVHLGVTEAGDGEDGRIKSAVGIGALLADGIGDTIRVSLTEEPEAEIPVAKAIAEYFTQFGDRETIPEINENPVNPYLFNRRQSLQAGNIGNMQAPVVIADLSHLKWINTETLKQLGFIQKSEGWARGDLSPDYLFCGNNRPEIPECLYQFCIVNEQAIKRRFLKGEFLICIALKDIANVESENDKKFVIRANTHQLGTEAIKNLKKIKNAILLLSSQNKNRLADYRSAVIGLINQGCKIPVIFSNACLTTNMNELQVASSCDLGGLFIDGLGDGMMITAEAMYPERIVELCFQILQSTGDRITKTEYIACPSCGRTNFNLMDTLAKIKAKTSHLKGLKIGVMGCIVNGPGEMADAHYGYVGAGKGTITLYKGKQVMKRAVTEKDAVDELLNLIKENGHWIDPVD